MDINTKLIPFGSPVNLDLIERIGGYLTRQCHYNQMAAREILMTTELYNTTYMYIAYCSDSSNLTKDYKRTK